MKGRAAKRAMPRLCGKVWVEMEGAVAISDAGADLLEQIAACGSLSEGARRLGFSYRRAWMLMNGMNRRWASPLITTAVGGERGGGTRITELGARVLSGYRDLQVQMEHLLDEATDSFRRSTGKGS